MPRITALDPRQADGAAKTLLDAVQRALGVTPNMMRTMAHSPAVLEGYLALSAALDKGSLGRKAAEPRAAAVLALAGAVIERRGLVSDGDLAAARKAGLSDGEIGEVVAHVALNVFTNYLNRLADTDVDFPAVRPPRGASQTAPAVPAAA